mmetsp:Transcript_16899/g.55297  ORF Transcript_16899/g.55297 Transcript_16899/m.55297 type:complete len:322 (+) Transcript_16899:73-1038(+)
MGSLTRSSRRTCSWRSRLRRPRPRVARERSGQGLHHRHHRWRVRRHCGEKSRLRRTRGEEEGRAARKTTRSAESSRRYHTANLCSWRSGSRGTCERSRHATRPHQVNGSRHLFDSCTHDVSRSSCDRKDSHGRASSALVSSSSNVSSYVASSNVSSYGPAPPSASSSSCAAAGASGPSTLARSASSMLAALASASRAATAPASSPASPTSASSISSPVSSGASSAASTPVSSGASSPALTPVSSGDESIGASVMNVSPISASSSAAVDDVGSCSSSAVSGSGVGSGSGSVLGLGGSGAALSFGVVDRGVGGSGCLCLRSGL